MDEFDSEKRDALAKKIVEKADKEYADFHKPFLTKGTEIYYAYIGQDREGQEPEEDWRSRVYPKSMKVKILAAYSQMIQPLGNNSDPINVEPRAGETNAEGALLMKETIKEQWEMADVAEKDKASVMDLLLYGNCCQQSPITTTNEEIDFELDVMKTVRMALLGKPQRQFKSVIKRQEFPDVQPRNIFDMRLHPFATSAQDGEGIFWRPFIDKFTLMELKRQAGYDAAAIKEAIKTEPSGSNNSDDGKDDRMAARGYTGKNRKGYDFLHYAGKLEADTLSEAGYQEFDGQQGFVEVVCEIVNAGDKPRIIKAMPNPTPNQIRPFQWCVYERVPYEVRGVGIGENILDMCDVITGATRLYIDAKKLALPMIAVNAQKRFPGSKFEIRPFKTFLFEGDPAQYFKEFQFADVSDGLMVLIEYAERMMDELSGMPKFTTGFDAKMVNKTATGLSMLINAQGQLMRGAIENFGEMIIEQRAKSFYLWNMMYHPDSRIKGRYKVSANGLSSMMIKEVQNNQLLQLLSFVINPTVAQNPNALKILRMVGHNMGIKNVDDALPSPDQLNMMYSKFMQPGPAPEAGMVSTPPGAMPAEMAAMAGGGMAA